MRGFAPSSDCSWQLTNQLASPQHLGPTCVMLVAPFRGVAGTSPCIPAARELARPLSAPGAGVPSLSLAISSSWPIAISAALLNDCSWHSI